MKKSIAVATVTFILVGCATPKLSEKGQSIRVLQGEPTKTCKYLARITGIYGGGWTAAGDLEGAMNELYNEAAQKGGTAVRIVSQQSNNFNTSIVGEAYDCSK